MSTKKVILGCDLSYARTGLVWLTDDYSIVAFQDLTFKPGYKRLLKIMKMFNEEVHQHPANLAVIEDLAYGAPSRIVVTKLAELGAIMKVVLEAVSIDYLTISPSAIKKRMTGKGTAEKYVVAQELDRLYGISFKEDKGFDLSDAAAAAVWGVQHLKEKMK